MGAQYLIGNFPQATTLGPVPVDTTALLKTMLQIVPSATNSLKVIEWGYSHDGSAAGVPGVVELIEVDVAATVTAHIEAGLCKYNAQALMNGNPTTNLIQVGTALTGYTATAEGTVGASRMLDPQLIAPTNQYVRQFPLGREPFVQIGKFLRVRVKYDIAVNILCYAIVEI